MADLYPVFDVPNFMEAPQSQNLNQRSVNFDFEIGDFTQKKTGELQSASPADAWAQWCIKSIYTQRDSFFSYSTNTGAEVDEALTEPTRGAQESALELTITETLMSDSSGRTTYVRDFEFEWGSDSVVITFTVGSIWDTEERLTVSL